MNILGLKITLQKARVKEMIKGDLPKGRTNKPQNLEDYAGLKSSLKNIKPAFYWSMIPEIRKLFAISSPLSSAVTTIVQLSNTGFNIKFSNGLKPKERLDMTNHLRLVTRQWGFGTAGIHGIIDKLLYQLMLGGANSVEWVVKKDLSGIDYLSLLNPETIRPVYNKKTQRYDYYQQITGLLSMPHDTPNLIKLNPKTFNYYALMSAEESPVGIPPFLSALPDLTSHKNMLNNINFIVEQVGLMGFLELLMDKPSQNDGESNTHYKNRLNTFLTDAKNSLNSGLKDGIIAGYKNDHEFKFNSISKDLGALPAIFSIVQKSVASGLKTPSVFLEGPENKTETQISIIFTKLIAQLKDIQNIIAHILEQGFVMELLLAGFNPEGIKVEFDPSTLTDALKKAQTAEINARVQHQLYADGITELDDYAIAMGYDQASQKEPRVDLNPVEDDIDGQVSKENKSKKNNDYDKSVRDKKKDQPKRR